MCVCVCVCVCLCVCVCVCIEFVNGGRVLSAKANSGSKSWNLHIQSSKGVTANAWNTLLDVFKSTIDRLDKKVDILKE